MLSRSCFDGEAETDGISSHCSPLIYTIRKNEGQRLISSSNDSLASASDTVAGKDLIIELTTSSHGSTWPLHEVRPDPVVVEKKSLKFVRAR